MATKALITGSFDPLTMGHLDIVERAAGLFDELTIGIIVNPSKNSMFTLKEREEMIKETVAHLENITVDSFSGLLADYVNENNYNVIVRGLRSSVDFDYELQMAQMNDRLFNDGVETVLLMSDPKYSFISSSVIKEVHTLGGAIDGLVPDIIYDKMKAKLARKK